MDVVDTQKKVRKKKAMPGEKCEDESFHVPKKKVIIMLWIM